MIDSGNILSDSFQTNANNNDGIANVASYIAEPSVEQFGNTLSSHSFVAKSHLDFSIKDYLSRPKLMYSGTLTDFTVSPGSWTYATDFLLSADIADKIKYHHLLRGTFQIKMIVTAAPYATGQLRLCHMYGTLGDYGPVSLTPDFLIANLAQKSHVSLDLGSATTCMLSIPLHIREPYHKIDSPNLTELNKLILYMFSMTQLQNSQTVSSVTAHYKIYVSMVDIEIAVPVPLTAPSQFVFADESLGVPVIPYQPTSYIVTDTTVFTNHNVQAEITLDPLVPFDPDVDLLDLPLQDQLNLFNEDRSEDLANLALEVLLEDDDSKPYLTFESDDEDLFYEQTSESHEANTGVISGPASVIASGASLFEDLPIIGPFALATRIGASAVGEIARLFGFSRPRDDSKPGYPHAANYAVSIGEVRAKQLTTDPNQEVTIDASFLGDKGDSLSFQNTIMRSGYCYRFAWTQSHTSGQALFNLPVSPMLSTISSNTFFVAPTPLAYSSLLFQAWRGSLVYNVVIPANRFVRGKLRVYWSPSSTASAINIVTNNALSVLIDLTQTIDMDITVPYLAETLYKAVSNFHDNTLIDERFINGFLHFVVEEPLIVNNSTWTAQILIHIRADHNFELAIPTNANLNSVYYSSFTPGNGIHQSALQNQQNPPTTKADNTLWYEQTSSGTDSNDVNPLLTSGVNLFPEACFDGKPALIHIGERIPSLRPLLKRFSPLTVYDGFEATMPGYMYNYFIPYYPQPQYTIVNNNTGNFIVTPYLNTPTTYLSRMFGGMRGTMRYGISDDDGSSVDYMYAQRTYGYDYNITYFDMKLANLSIFNSMYRYGQNLFRKEYEPLVIDLPYQNAHWFYPTAIALTATYTGTTADEQGLGVQKYGLMISERNVNANQKEKYITQAVGEDFQFVIYNGPPIIYSRIPFV